MSPSGENITTVSNENAPKIGHMCNCGGNGAANSHIFVVQRNVEGVRLECLFTDFDPSRWLCLDAIADHGREKGKCECDGGGKFHFFYFLLLVIASRVVFCVN